MSTLKEQLGMEFSRRDLTPEQRVAMVTWFFGSYCRHIKGPLTGQTIQFEPWMLDGIIRPIFGTVDRYHRRKFTTALVGMPRKHMKSLLGSGIGLYALLIEAMWEPGAEIYAIAAKKDQAQKVFRPAKQMVEMDPFLSAYCKVYKDVIYCPEHGSEFRVLASDAPSEHGGNPFMYLIDELHAHPNMDMYEAMKTGTAVRDEPLGLILTTAGKQRSGPLWDMLQSKPGRREFRYWIGAPAEADATDPKVWRAANPASWVTQSYLRDQFEDPLIKRAGFEAFHLNRFPMMKGASQAVAPADLDKCARQASRFTFDNPFVVGIDGAQNGDAFGIVYVQAAEDGFFDFHEYVFDDPPEETGFYDLVQVEQIAVEAYAEYRCPIFIDPSRLLLMAQHLDQTYGVPFIAVKQENKAMCTASALLVNAVRSGKARLGGCPKLVEHLGNAILLERDPYGERLGSVGKGSSKLLIDAAIAAAIGMYGLATTEQAPSFEETGGVWSIPV